MKTYIALFRGINVGGKNSLPMKELVAILGELQCQNIKTYIQSGNVAFASKENNASQLSKRISGEIKKHRPEAESDPKTLHVGFLASAPKDADLKKLESFKSGSERFRLIDHAFYLHAPDGIGRSKLAANTERLLRVSMTDRNWRTVCKLMEMAKG